ncbi:hypothetical protein V3C99_013082 [Haemonchus contortus]
MRIGSSYGLSESAEIRVCASRTGMECDMPSSLSLLCHSIEAAATYSTLLRD